MKRTLKTTVSILLCLTMLFQVGGWAFAAGISGKIQKGSTVTADGDDEYYYVALGDSVAAGFMVEDSVEPSKYYSSMFVDTNRKNSPVDSYPALVAGREYESYVENYNAKAEEVNAEIEARKAVDPENTEELIELIEYPSYYDVNRKTLQTELYKQGLISDMYEQFDYANLGTSAFMMHNYIQTLLDKDHIVEIYQTFVDVYADDLAAYQSSSAGFRTTMYNRLRNLFLQCVASWDTVNESYQAITDTTNWTYSAVTGCEYLMINYSGYDIISGLPVYKSLPVTGTLDAATFTEWVNNRVKLPCVEYNSAGAAYYSNVNYDDWFDSYYAYYLKLVTGDLYKYHDVFWEELSKADLITINVGSNNLLEQFMSQISEFCMGDEYTLNEDSTYSNLHNPVAYAIYIGFSALMGSGLGIDTAMAAAVATLANYINEITMADIVEALKFFSSENISEQLMVNAEEAMAQYSTLIDIIHKGGRYTYQGSDGKTYQTNIEAVNPDAQIVFVGLYNPYGTSLTYNGKSYDYGSVLYRMISAVIGTALYGDDYQYYGDNLMTSSWAGYTNSSDVYTQGISTFNQYMEQVYQYLWNKVPTKINEKIMSSAKGLLSYLGLTDTPLANYLAIVLQELQYPMIYNLFGKPGEEACEYMNRYIQNLAETTYADLNIPYVDVYNAVSNESDTNPHPLAKGHYEIYSAIIDTVVCDVHVTSNLDVSGNMIYDFWNLWNNSGTYTIPDTVLYNHSMTGDIKTSGTVYAFANGKPLTLVQNGSTYSFTLPNVQTEQYIYLWFGDNLTTQTITFTDGTKTDTYYSIFGQGFCLPEYPSAFARISGKSFAGWSINGELYQPGDLYYGFTGDTTVRAAWVDMVTGEAVENKTYYVVVTGSKSANSGAGSYCAGDTVMLDAGESAVAYDQFKGWTASGVTLTDTTSKKTSFIMPDNNVTVNAGWTSSASYGTCTLSFVTYSEVTFPAITAKSGTTIDLSKYIPTRTGANFSGWYTYADSTKAVTSVTLTGNITVYAGWTELSNNTDNGFNNFKNTTSYYGYPDVDENSWYGANKGGYIRNATQIGIINGYTDGKFRPTANIKLSEVIKIAATIYSTYIGDGHVFTPIAGMAWYVPYLSYCIEKGIVSSTIFDNYERIATRAEVAYILAHALPYEALPAISRLVPPDVSATHSYYSEIRRLYAAGVYIGSDQYGTFQGERPITRAEISTVISRMVLPSTRIAY